MNDTIESSSYFSQRTNPPLLGGADKNQKRSRRSYVGTYVIRWYDTEWRIGTGPITSGGERKNCEIRTIGHADIVKIRGGILDRWIRDTRITFRRVAFAPVVATSTPTDWLTVVLL